MIDILQKIDRSKPIYIPADIKLLLKRRH